jgi:hypothetical protein
MVGGQSERVSRDVKRETMGKELGAVRHVETHEFASVAFDRAAERTIVVLSSQSEVILSVVNDTIWTAAGTTVDDCGPPSWTEKEESGKGRSGTGWGLGREARCARTESQETSQYTPSRFLRLVN